MSRLALLFSLLFVCCCGSLQADAPAKEDSLRPEAGRLLVAKRGLYGPYFAKTVIYLLQHDEQGTVGLVVNRPLGKRVAELLPDMHSFEQGSLPVYQGGPVSPRVMVMLFRGHYTTDRALHIREDIYASSNLGMLAELMAAHKGGAELRMFAGQANWKPGQLQQELDSDSWYVIDTDAATLFDNKTDKLWQRLINQIDPTGILVLN